MKRFIVLLLFVFAVSSVMAINTGPPSAKTGATVMVQTVAANTIEQAQAGVLLQNSVTVTRIPIGTPLIVRNNTSSINNLGALTNEAAMVTAIPSLIAETNSQNIIPSESYTTTINPTNQSPLAATYSGTPPIVLVESPLYNADMTTTTIVSPAQTTKTSMVMQTHRSIDQKYRVSNLRPQIFYAQALERMGTRYDQVESNNSQNSPSIANDQGQVVAATIPQAQAMQQLVQSTV